MGLCWRTGKPTEKEEKDRLLAYVPIEFFDMSPDVSVLSRVVCCSVLIQVWEELVIDIKASDQDLSALVDTGDNANFIETTVFEENQVFRNLVAPCEPINMTLTDRSAGPIITNTIITDIEYAGDTYHNEELLVAATTTTDVVLGQKFLKKNKCCIDCAKHTVKCSPNSQDDAACPEMLAELTPVSKGKNPPPSSDF